MKSVFFHNKALTDDLMLTVEMMKKFQMNIPLERLSKEELKERLEKVKKEENYEMAALIRNVLIKREK